MATNTHTTTTVRVRLDLGELITKLRDLADTLETTQKPKTDDEGKPEASADPWCDGCGADYQMGEPHFGDCSAPECKHEAWDVHPNGITRHCSDCREPLPVIPTQHEPTLAQVIAAENVANTYDLQPLRCPRCDDPWHPRTICPACGCDKRPK